MGIFITQMWNKIGEAELGLQHCTQLEDLFELRTESVRKVVALIPHTSQGPFGNSSTLLCHLQMESVQARRLAEAWTDSFLSRTDKKFEELCAVASDAELREYSRSAMRFVSVQIAAGHEAEA